jgi:hypothetical protein
MSERTPLTQTERHIVAIVSRASFPPATASKRFMRDLASGQISKLSHRGRCFLAFVAHRFRRQYVLPDDEWKWVMTWLHAPPATLPLSLDRYIDKLEKDESKRDLYT